jgi:hypothetical protein
MKITLTKHGGFAAGMFRPPSIVASSTLMAADAAELSRDAAELSRLVMAVKMAPIEQGEEPGQARDAMSYTMTIEEDGAETTVITQSDINMSPAFADLIQWIDRR